MFDSVALATGALPQRLDDFRRTVERLFCPMHVEVRSPERDSFRGRIESASLGRVGLVTVTNSACTIRRLTTDVARVPDAGYLIKFQIKGESIWSQRNRDVHLRTGDFVVASMMEPYSLTLKTAYAMSVIPLEAATMRRLTPDPERLLGLRMSSEHADCALLSSVVREIALRVRRLSEPMRRRIEPNLLDILGTVLSTRSAGGALSPEQQLAQIKLYIRSHLHDRCLTTAAIAGVFGLSTRYLHLLFEREPKSIGRYIRSLRLEACRRMLLDEDARSNSLTSIALHCGFYDLSHMTRCFREEFGTTPMAVRSRQQSDARLRDNGLICQFSNHD